MDLPDLSELRAKSQKNRIDFLETDLALCFTFLDVVTTELQMGEPQAAMRAHAKAEDGYRTITRFLQDVDDGPQKQALEQKLGELRAKLRGPVGCFL